MSEYRLVAAGGTDTAVIDTGGSGSSPGGTGQPPVLLLHGSGPGVSAAANWRPVISPLRASRRVIAPDQLGFGGTATGGKHTYGRAAWTDHALSLLDELGVGQCDVIGNSMGGAIALSLAVARPAAIRRIVLMGTMGVAMALPPGLATIWSYRPSVEAMREVIGLFAYNRSLITDELVQMRYESAGTRLVGGHVPASPAALGGRPGAVGGRAQRRQPAGAAGARPRRPGGAVAVVVGAHG
jgi:2-hydroxymuconate-semialdehyde hydrolase